MTRQKEIAEVNGEQIYQWQLYDSMANYSREVLKKDLQDLTPTEYRESKEEALEKLIASELLFSEAQDAGFTVSEEEVEQAITDFTNNLRENYSFEDYLRDRDLSLEDFKKVIRKQLIKERFVAQIISKIPVPTSKDVDSFYEKVKDKLCCPPQFAFYVCYTSKPSEAEKERFKNAFVNLANKKMEKDIAESILSSAPQLSANFVFSSYERTSQSLPKEIIDLLMKLEETQFSPIFEAEDELSIFYLFKKEINKPLTEEDGREEAKKYLAIVRVKKVLDAYIDSLKDKYDVKIFLNE